MRKVCRVLNFSRARLRTRAVAAAASPRLDEVLAARLQRLIELHPTFGYRRLWALLRLAEGICVNSSDVPGVIGRSMAASRRISRSIVSSPTLRLSRLTSSSSSASSSFGRARSAFSAPSRNRLRHSSFGHLLPVTPCRLSCRRFTLEQADHQCGTTLRRPALHFRGPLFVCHLPPRRSFDLGLLVARSQKGAGYLIVVERFLLSAGDSFGVSKGEIRRVYVNLHKWVAVLPSSVSTLKN
jgi:hypothetical protein